MVLKVFKKEAIELKVRMKKVIKMVAKVAQKRWMDLEKKMKKTGNPKKKINLDENIIVSPLLQTCSQILVSGPRKGMFCGCKTTKDNDLCTRHRKKENI